MSCKTLTKRIRYFFALCCLKRFALNHSFPPYDHFVLNFLNFIKVFIIPRQFQAGKEDVTSHSDRLRSVGGKQESYEQKSVSHGSQYAAYFFDRPEEHEELLTSSKRL